MREELGDGLRPAARSRAARRSRRRRSARCTAPGSPTAPTWSSRSSGPTCGGASWRTSSPWRWSPPPRTGCTPAVRVANLPGFVELFAQLALQELDFRLEAAQHGRARRRLGGRRGRLLQLAAADPRPGHRARAGDGGAAGRPVHGGDASPTAAAARARRARACSRARSSTAASTATCTPATCWSTRAIASRSWTSASAAG